ncbi:MAG: type I methionyl aminopeptidase [Actinomycetota bacterium]|nr:type I methionyl aminopeptidase [Actinomycetota bacterium]
MYRGGIILKTPAQLDAMAAAGRVHARCLKMLIAKCRPGVTTAELDRVAEKFIRSQGGGPTFKGYRGFPRAICASPNAMVVHGIPNAQPLRRGDVLSLDVGVTKNGWVADGAVTVAIGEIDEETERLLDATDASLHAGLAQAQVGNRLSDVSHAVQETVEAAGFEVIRSLVGHGVGREMHEDPQVPNYGPPGRGPRLEPGMVFALEPMTAAGTHEIVQGDDGWAVYSADGSMTAHFEFTIAVTEDGPRILTPWHE